MTILFWRPGAALTSVVLIGLALAQPAVGEIRLEGVAQIPGNAKDLAPADQVATPEGRYDQLGGISALEYTGQGGRFLALSDRGPGDGVAQFPCRFHALDIQIQPGAKIPVSVELKSTRLLLDEQGQKLLGAASAIDAKRADGGRRFDPEGVRLLDKRLFISDEYGPTIAEFDLTGKRTRLIPLPEKFRCSQPRDTKETENTANKSGRQSNKGMEGLAITPDGKFLLGAIQAPLLQDHGLDAKGKKLGVNTRLVQVDLATGQTKEFVYVFDNPNCGISEILAINAHQFLVIDRDGEHGAEAKDKKIVWIDTAGASDVSNVATLPAKGLPDGVVPVARKPFLDFLDPRWKLAGENFPEKQEGLAFGPPLPDGRLTLVVAIDNDGKAENPTWFYVYSLDKDDLKLTNK